MLTVSRDLAEIARQLSGHPHVHSIPNGVDTSIFHMRNRDEARAELKLARDQAIVLFVGRLVQAKGVVQLDGRMVERMHADMARRTVAIADAISARL